MSAAVSVLPESDRLTSPAHFQNVGNELCPKKSIEDRLHQDMENLSDGSEEDHDESQTSGFSDAGQHSAGS